MTRLRRHPHRRPRQHPRQGKILVLVAIALPALCGLIGLVVDGGLLLSAARQAQHVADSAATAAAMEKQHGQSNAAALAVAEQFVRDYNLLANATVTLHCPPASGEFAGSARHVEVQITDTYATFVVQILGGNRIRQVCARAVAGFEPTTAGAAIVVLDPDPPPFQIAPLGALPILPSLPAIVGGMEVLGLGTVRVEGAVHVNNQWGGKDGHGLPLGEPAGLLGLSHAVAATPLVGLTHLKAHDIRVVGGVDNPHYYAPLASGDPAPLTAGRLPVPDPFKDLPVPTSASDPSNVKSTNYHGKTVLGLPLIGPPITLQPGVYDWIEVVSGKAIFQPGIYIIRGKNPLTQISLSMLAGEVHADGVMFYITDSAGYSTSSGMPDAADGESTAPFPALGNTLPAVVINIGLLGSRYSGLNDPSSPFHGMLIYQRRHDRRPIVVVQENLLGPGQFRGTVYSKWGHVILAGKGTYDTRFVVGTLRLVALLDMQIAPSYLLPAAEDVFLVE